MSFLSIRDIVIALADKPTPSAQAAFSRALSSSRLFVKLIGKADGATSGTRIVVGNGRLFRGRMARLSNGMTMIVASVVPPRRVADDEMIATMTGPELLDMMLKTDADGLMITAEDERNSWTALTREGVGTMLDEMRIRTHE